MRIIIIAVLTLLLLIAILLQAETSAAPEPEAAALAAVELISSQPALMPKPTPEPTPEPTSMSAAYTETAKDYIENPEPEVVEPERYTEAEKKLIARVVWAESRGECFEGQVAVAVVVINRYESGKFGKTVKRVVYAPHQFAVGKKYNEESMRAVEAAIAGTEHPDDMYFFRRSRRKEWYDHIYLYRIGNHSFYSAHRK